MTGRQIFEANLVTIERVIAIVCRRGGLFGADAEDFASDVRLALIEDDYAVLARYEGRSSLDTFLTVVIQRLLADARTRAKGRWHASSEAQRLGELAVQAETLVHRDGRTVDEAMPHIRAAHPGATREEVVALLDRLPRRTARPRPVDLETAGHAVATHDTADRRAVDGDRQRLSAIAGQTMRDAMRGWPVEDRMLIRLRFGRGMSIADVARILQVPQRPLYRRLESLLVQLRGRLLAAGVDAAAADELIGRDFETDLDFGLDDGKSAVAGQSIAAREDV